MRNLHGRAVTGPPITGQIHSVTDNAGQLAFTVNDDGALRTIIIDKPGATVRIEASGTITITEA